MDRIQGKLTRAQLEVEFGKDSSQFSDEAISYALSQWQPGSDTFDVADLYHLRAVARAYDAGRRSYGESALGDVAERGGKYPGPTRGTKF